MRYGPLVAKRWKKQYFNRGKWRVYTLKDGWQNTPEELYTILLELRTKEACSTLVGKSWTFRLPKAV